MMTANKYRRGVGHCHKMMDRGLDKKVIEDELIKFGFNNDQIEEVFGIVLRATMNKLKKYYRKEEIEEVLNR